MTGHRVLARHWRLRGTTTLAARHPRRIRTIAATPATAAAAVCLAGLVLTVVVAVTAGPGWDYAAAPAVATRILVPVVLAQIAVGGALYLSLRTLSPTWRAVMSGLWLIPLAVTALMAGGAGRAPNDTVLFVWGCTGLAMTLWVIGWFETARMARLLCYGSPLILVALWSAAGPVPEATVTAGVTLAVFAAAALVVVPGYLVVRGIADLPRVHRWARHAQRWLAGGERLLWVIGAKVVLLAMYLVYAQWRFPELTFVPSTVTQWGVALGCAVLAILPMRLARHRTMDEARVQRIGQTVGFILGSAVGLAVCLALGLVVIGRDSLAATSVLVALMTAAAALSRTRALTPRRHTAAMLLTPLAVTAGFLLPVRGPGEAVAEEISMAWLVTVLAIGAGLALVATGWLTWRYGELWWAVRALVFIGLWIGLVQVLGASGIGLAAVDLVLTAILVGAALWIRRHPRSRIAAVEVLALCAVPVVVFYAPDLLAGLPAAARPWLVGAALVAPGIAAIWHHLGLEPGEETADHTAGLGGLGAVYGMVAACVLVAGATSTQVIPGLAEAVLTYVGIPLTILFIALLEGRSTPRSQADQAALSRS